MMIIVPRNNSALLKSYSFITSFLLQPPISENKKADGTGDHKPTRGNRSRQHSSSENQGSNLEAQGAVGGSEEWTPSSGNDPPKRPQTILLEMNFFDRQL